MKKWLMVILIVCLLSVAFGTAGYAISLFSKQVAGLGKMTFTDEVTIVNVKVKSLTKVNVDLESKGTTQVDYVYSVYLYLDDVKWPNAETVSWTLGEIPGTKKKISFTGLDLTIVLDVDVEVEG